MPFFVFFPIFQLWHLNYSKTKIRYRNSKRSWVVQDNRIYLLCNFRDDLWNDVGVFDIVFSYFSTLTFNILESIIAREIIPAGTGCIWCGKYDGTIKKNFRAAIFFQNGCHIAKKSTLSDYNENWYLEVLCCGEHDGNIGKNFWTAIFFRKWPPYCEISTLSDFNENLDLGVISCGKHDGVIEIVFWAIIFLSLAFC